MTIKHNDLSLSRLELALLARYAGTKIPDEETVTSEVIALAYGASPPSHARGEVAKARAALRSRALLEVKETTKRAKVLSSSRLTATGEQVLRSAFSLASKPTWARIRDGAFPAMGLKLRPGSAEAAAAQASMVTLMIEILHRDHQTPRAAKVDAVCDAMITEMLGLPVGPIASLEWLRTQILARKTGSRDAKGTPLELAKRIVAPEMKEPLTKTALNQVLGRRWVAEQTDHQLDPPRPPPPSPPLLEVVREIIPQVGSDGRFGPEKVFVSAIWRSLERDRRVNGDLSIDRFKRWLLTANRDGHLVLARADLINAMNAKLVAESEIRDQGATFHFVLDQRPAAAASERRIHAR